MLTIKQISALKPRESRYSIQADTLLYVEVLPTGKKTWFIKTMNKGKVIKRKLGDYPALSFFDARSKRDELLQLIKSDEWTTSGVTEPTFAEVADEWMRKKCEPTTGDKNIARQRSRLERIVLPVLGKMNCRTITAPLVLREILRPIEDRGENDLAHAISQLISMILRFAVASGYADSDVIPNLRGALAPVVVTHFPRLETEEEIGELLRKIDALPDSSSKMALQLLAYTFVRPGEARAAQWSEINFERGEWRIPAKRMKMRREHIVPLSRQVISLLRKAQKLAGGSPYVFPSGRRGIGCISADAYRSTLRRLGYGSGSMTAHGFRSIASTTLNENAWNSDAIERQLSHVEGNKVRAAYCHAEFLDERRKMMQWYADHLDLLRDSSR